MTANITKLVSVIIPAYNHENYIQDTIKSIIEQTYKTIELIIVDDGSKDLTWQKIQEVKEQCEKRFVNVIFETKQNEGTCKTLNKLLSLAKGEYVYLIASDDMAKPTAIEKEVIFLENNLDYALCVGDDEFIDSENKVCFWGKDSKIVYNIHKAKCKSMKNIFNQKIKSLDNFGTYESLVKGNYIPNGYLIRRNIFDKIGNFTPEAPLEDYWLMLQIAKYSKMKFIDEILYSYRQHSSNTIKNENKMIMMTTKTIEYEQLQIKNNNSLLSMWEQRKIIINLFICKMYKIVSWNFNKTYIEFFGKKKCIKSRCKVKYIKPFLIHCHIYYKETYFELKEYIENIKTYPFDIFFTLVENHRDIIDDMKMSFPNATVKIVKNRGYDIGPFIDILNSIDLDKYSYVIKIHTKRNMPLYSIIDSSYYNVSKSKFRNYCLSFLEKKNFKKCIKTLKNNNRVGMIGNYHLILNVNRFETIFKEIKNFIQQKKIKETINKRKFVAGTMFICRAEIFKTVQDLDISAVDFNNFQLPYVLERLFGFLVYVNGYTIQDCYSNKILQCLGKILTPLRLLLFTFIFNIKITNSGKLLIKICKIPVLNLSIHN